MLFDFFRETPGDVLLALNQSSVDWDDFLQQASVEYMLPAVMSRARALGVESALPGEISEICETAEALNDERNKQILEEAVHAATLLNQIGIKPLVLKGVAYLLTGVYTIPTRYLMDIDLLVAHEDIPRAADYLQQHGYFESDGGELKEFRHHHPALRRAGQSHIEIHHRLGQGICKRLLPAADMLANATEMNYGGARFLTPSPTHLMTHLILHSQLAHPYSELIFPRLRALVDLFQAQTRFGAEIKWPQIAKSFRENGEFSTLALHIKHAHQLLGFEMPQMAWIFKLGFFDSLRWQRRLFLNRYPGCRFADPIYLVMSLISRRLRLVPEILQNPKSWPRVLRLLTQPKFYRNLFAV